MQPVIVLPDTGSGAASAPVAVADTVLLPVVDGSAPPPVADPMPTLEGPAGPSGSDDAPPPPTVEAEPRPRAVGGRPTEDLIAFGASILGSLSLVWVLFEKVLPLSGTLGFLVCWYVAFIALYAAITACSYPWPVVLDRIMSALVHGGAALVGSALVVAVSLPFVRGISALRHVNFYVHDMAGVRPTAALTHGGILHAILGSFIEVGIAACIALPLGVGTAVFMSEVGGGLSRAVRTVVEAMTALPDILAGLFIYATLILKLGVERSGFAAAMALTVMMLPIIARSADVSLRVVPGGLREAGLALGSSTWQTVWRVVLPTARSGLATALILGVARAVGETAPVLITSGASTFLNYHPFTNPMNSLPLYIYTAVRSGQPLFIARGYAAAAVLMTIVLLLFVLVRLLARPRKGSR